MIKRYCVWIVKTKKMWYSDMFMGDLARSLQYAFRCLGYDVPIVDERPEDDSIVPIILLPQLIIKEGGVFPENAILYNLEQLESASGITNDYLKALCTYEVWDYSVSNIRYLQRIGAHNVHLCKVGYAPTLEDIPINRRRELEVNDIAFYGSAGSRRQYVLDSLKTKGVEVDYIRGSYGQNLADKLSCSKVVLNVHLWPAKILEVVRLSYLIANKRYIVTERGRDLDLEAPFYDILSFASYDGLTQACIDALALSSSERFARADFAYDIFKSSMRQERYVADALESSGR